MGGEMNGGGGWGLFFLWVVPLLGQFVREQFSSSPHCKV